MSLYSAVHFLRPLACIAASVLLAACANTGALKPSATVNALYAQLDQASVGYQTAAQQARAGDADAARKTLTQALDTLKTASANCGRTQGCDTQRFFSVFDHLLRLKDGGLLDDSGLDSETDFAENGIAGEGSEGPGSTQAQRSVTLLRGQKLSELIAMNGPVKAALEMWLTQWRPNLMDAYVNYEYLRSQMEPAYAKTRLPEALLFGIMAKESGGKVHAVSRSGAAGPLQFMYATGMRFGLTSDSGFDMRFDPAAAARANAEYIDEQLEKFNNNLELTLAAYNGGEGRMRRLAGDNPSISFYDPKIYNQLSPETREYVPAVLAAAWLFLHPDSYNLHFPKVDGTPVTIELQRPASLTELTVCLGSAGGMSDGWFRTLRNLNPRLEPQATQPTGARLQVPKALKSAYAKRCVTGPWPILAADLHAAVVPTVATPTAAKVTATATRSGATHTYKIRKGDTLIGIVRKLQCSSVQEVEHLNDLKHHRLAVGHTIKLPSCP